MNEQQFFPFYEPNKPNIAIMEIQATEEQKKEMVNLFSDIILERIKERARNKYAN